MYFMPLFNFSSFIHGSKWLNWLLNWLSSLCVLYLFIIFNNSNQLTHFEPKFDIGLYTSCFERVFHVAINTSFLSSIPSVFLHVFSTSKLSLHQNSTFTTRSTRDIHDLCYLGRYKKGVNLMGAEQDKKKTKQEKNQP